LATILHINTAFAAASVFLSRGESILSLKESHTQKEHASFVEPAIKEICNSSGIDLKDIDAISVVNGPGSYTGLRVGLASAKALCYALNKPLILLNTLDIMAYALKFQSNANDPDIMFCPVIDARRAEVFTALYDNNVNIIETYSAELVDEFFLQRYSDKTIIIGGDGSLKVQNLLNSENFIYINPLLLTSSIVLLCASAFDKQIFSSIAYSEPFYLKPVYFKK
jgi:tRNA threonylcarbamoyladenosine biosynthesis protein TsaB